MGASETPKVGTPFSCMILRYFNDCSILSCIGYRSVCPSMVMEFKTIIAWCVFGGVLQAKETLI